MKKLFTTFIAIILTINAFAIDVWDGTSSPWMQGSGTENDPYLIETAENLAYLAEKVNEGYQAQGMSVFKGVYFLLTDDLDLNNINWTPIGTASLDMNGYLFSGVFNGGYHKIDKLSITSSQDGASLFMGLNENGEIKNLSITNGAIISNGQGAAGIVSGITDNARVHRCGFSGSISVTGSGTYCGGGGIAAIAASNSTISECWFAGTFNSTNTSFIGSAGAGGIVGFAQDNAKIQNCYNAATITINGNLMSVAAGILGASQNSYSVKVTNCYNVGTLDAGTKGGIFGMISPINPTKDEASLEVTDCYYLNTCGGTTNYGTSMTSTEMQAEQFKNQLDQSEHIWVMDNGTNNGYPIHSLVEFSIFEAEEIEAHTARLSANIHKGNDNIERAYFSYSITDETEWTEIDVATDGFVEAVLEDLEPNTTYMFTITLLFSDDIVMTSEQLFFETLDNESVAETNKHEIMVYPNPTSDYIFIENIEPQSVTIYSLDGKLIKTVENTNVIDIRDLNEGIYLINIDGAIKKFEVLP